MALYSDDQLRRAVVGPASSDYLARSAAILRHQVSPPLPHTKTSIDRDIRLILHIDGPIFVNATSLGDKLCVRRVGNIFYTREFAALILSESILSFSSTSALTARTARGSGSVDVCAFLF